ncbi:hypothetical protein SmJEL517_g00763 [Synchytrium microbalum]|uniref:BRISC and BRCA1-A complex member 1 n=1 Tax=Synchytrium microbalum TaxID=1806994 RepID=A0A507CHF7_9FUNG|nr:uncharacterized protein SmJEL517_g00763 [Synchytrium microbalum]TPX37464.1 hypothetical protein SmJEL517_g00763 [Synchytrium microbalum]
MGTAELKPPGSTRLNMTKRLIKRFVWLKSHLLKDHEYGLVELGNEANWHTPFTSDPESIIGGVDSLQRQDDPFNSLNSDSILETLLQAQPENPKTPESHSLRAIIIYGRSNVLPTVPSPELLDKVRANPAITIDCVYLHGLARDYGEMVQEIYERLTEFELREDMYSFELSQRAPRYGIAMTQLVSHPAQRVHQARAFPIVINQ